MKDKNTTWLIDSSIYVFKAWFTYPEQQDLNNKAINAVLGFLEFTYQLLNTERPKYIAFAFDESLETSHRRDIYPDYKANRPPAPESLKYQFKLCREFIGALGIYQQASLHYEADDLIGTWATHLHRESIPVNIITADKDLAQLIKEGDHWWEYLRGEKLDTKKITKRFGVRPDQIADILAIAGDKTDNIPGVPGIGMSTAAKIIRKFDNLGHLFANVNDISEMQIRGASRVQELIIEHQSMVALSRQLTEIVCNIEDTSRLKFRIKSPDIIELRRLCNQLNLPEGSTQNWIDLSQSL